MRPDDFEPGCPGKLVPIPEGPPGTFAYVLQPLPRTLALSSKTIRLLSAAERSIGRLCGRMQSGFNPFLIARPLLRREALISSRMEGTKTTAARLVSLEAASDSASDAETREVQNYMVALSHGRELLAELPVCLRLIRAVHQRLLSGVRGEREAPGKFRTIQNYIGHGSIADARFIPPPPSVLDPLLRDLESFLNAGDDDALPLLVRLAMVHYQFETIHPFGDGNGRVGRLLVPLSLEAEGYLSHPTLYVSGFFERRKRAYTDLMLAVSQRGAWEAWIQFFLEALAESARDSEGQANALVTLRGSYQKRFHQARNSALTLKLVDSLFDMPLLTATRVQELLDVSPATANKHIHRLVEEGIVQEVTGRQRDREFLATAVLELIEVEATGYSVQSASNAAPSVQPADPKS
jgi:Fic family protein